MENPKKQEHENYGGRSVISVMHSSTDCPSSILDVL